MIQVDQNTYINNSSADYIKFRQDRDRIKQVRDMSNRITQLETQVTKIMTLLEELNDRIK